MVLAHEFRIGAWRRTVLGPGIESRHVRRHARMRQRIGQALPYMTAERPRVFLPALRHEREEFVRRLEGRMNVAIDDREALFGGRLLLRKRDIDVHCRTSCPGKRSRSRE